MDNKNTSKTRVFVGGWLGETWVNNIKAWNEKLFSCAYAYKLGIATFSPPVPGWFKPPWANLISSFGGHAYNQDQPVKGWRELTTPRRSRFRRIVRYQLCRLYSSQHFLLHCRFPTSPLPKLGLTQQSPWIISLITIIREHELIAQLVKFNGNSPILAFHWLLLPVFETVWRQKLAPKKYQLKQKKRMKVHLCSLHLQTGDCSIPTVIPSLKLTAKAPETRPKRPKRKRVISTIHFQKLC